MTIWDQWNNIPGWDQVQKTQKYLQATPLFQQHIHDILFKYGVDPGGQADMAGTSVDFSNDPYSVVNVLKRNAVDADHSAVNQAAFAGLEDSGAMIAARNAANEDYKKNYQGALTSLGGEISGEVGNYVGTVGGIFDDLEKAPAPAAPAVDTSASGGYNAADAAANGDVFERAAGAHPNGAGLGSPATPGNPWHIPDANGNALTVAKQLKKTAVPVVGGRGHVT